MLLDKIVEIKRQEVEELKKKGLASRRELPLLDFKKAIFQKDKISLIAEIKKASPSAGDIVADFDPAKIASIYRENNASAISVLTDRRFFKGDLSFIKIAKKESGLPILRKDFIIDQIQIDEAYNADADAILLIARILSKNQLAEFILKARELGLSALVETHDERDIEKALEARSEIVGVNNRDLDTLQIDFSKSLKLVSKYPEIKAKVTVSESGIREKAQILELKGAGFSAVLIGESILKSNLISKKIHELFDE